MPCLTNAELYPIEHARRCCSRQQVQLYIHKVGDEYMGEITVIDYDHFVYLESSHSLPEVLAKLLEETSYDRRVHESYKIDKRKGDVDEGGCTCNFASRRDR